MQTQQETSVDTLSTKLFQSGPFKGQTYAHVLEHEKDFCNTILSQIKSPHTPDDFKYLLLHKSFCVELDNPKQFVKKLSPEAVDYLLKIVNLNDDRVQIRRVHLPSRRFTKTNSFKGVFYRLFYKIFIFDVKNEQFYVRWLDEYASAFPFHVSKDVSRTELAIFKSLDDGFYEEMQIFLNEHFYEPEDCRNICEMMLLNIDQFQRNHLPKSVLRTANHEECAPAGYKLPFEDLEGFYKVGVQWYQEVFRIYQDVQKEFGKPIIALWSTHNDLLMLPEQNFLEMYSLLDEDNFTDNRRDYTELMKKYLFFFVRAVDKDEHPVRVIDQVLFECFKSLHKIRRGRFINSEFLYDVAMVSQIQRRKHPINGDRFVNYDVHDLRFLGNIREHVRRIPGLRNGDVDCCGAHDEGGDFEYNITLYCNCNCYETYFSYRPKYEMKHFLESILCAAVMPPEKLVKRIVLYNMYRGEESRIEMPRNKVNELRQFLRACYRQKTKESECLPFKYKYLEIDENGRPVRNN